MAAINLNADLGESFGAYTIGNDVNLLKAISSANVACGFHAGDPVVMYKTVRESLKCGVSIGAHPSFPDLQGFGRREMRLSSDEVYALIAYQVGSLMGVAQTLGAKVTHVKPHGALNNMACEDFGLAATICRAVKDVDPDLIFLAPALSELSKASENAGLKTAKEIFADRAYTGKATLVNRREEGAVIHNGGQCLQRVLDMLDKGGIITRSGKVLKTDIHSICVHGDTPSACESAALLQKGLANAGFDLMPLDQLKI